MILLNGAWSQVKCKIKISQSLAGGDREWYVHIVHIINNSTTLDNNHCFLLSRDEELNKSPTFGDEIPRKFNKFVILSLYFSLFSTQSWVSHFRQSCKQNEKRFTYEIPLIFHRNHFWVISTSEMSERSVFLLLIFCISKEFSYQHEEALKTNCTKEIKTILLCFLLKQILEFISNHLAR